ncbi:hypothetical protein Drorol1_Dr00010553 [Drosera rotundifolia]
MGHPRFAATESRGDKGIWKRDIKKELNSIKPTYVDNYINKLLSDGRIKEFVPKEGPKGKPLLIAMHIEPAEELTGGIWNCLECIKGCVAVSATDVLGFIKKRDLYKVKISWEQIKDVLGSLVLDNMIVECKSTGFGEFARIPVGTVCYKLRKDSRQRGGRAGAMALIPCGACPRINDFSPSIFFVTSHLPAHNRAVNPSLWRRPHLCPQFAPLDPPRNSPSPSPARLATAVAPLLLRLLSHQLPRLRLVSGKIAALVNEMRRRSSSLSGFRLHTSMVKA